MRISFEIPGEQKEGEMKFPWSAVCKPENSRAQWGVTAVLLHLGSQSTQGAQQSSLPPTVCFALPRCSFMDLRGASQFSFRANVQILFSLALLLSVSQGYSCLQSSMGGVDIPHVLQVPVCSGMTRYYTLSPPLEKIILALLHYVSSLLLETSST